MKRLNTKVERRSHYLHGTYRDFHSVKYIGTSYPSSGIDKLAVPRVIEVSPFRNLGPIEEARIVCPGDLCKAVITRDTNGNNTEIYVDRAGKNSEFADCLRASIYRALGFEPRKILVSDLADFAKGFDNDAARYLQLVGIEPQFGERISDIWIRVEHAGLLIGQGMDSKRALSEAGVPEEYQRVM